MFRKSDNELMLLFGKVDQDGEGFSIKPLGNLTPCVLAWLWTARQKTCYRMSSCAAEAYLRALFWPDLSMRNQHRLKCLRLGLSIDLLATLVSSFNVQDWTGMSSLGVPTICRYVVTWQKSINVCLPHCFYTGGKREPFDASAEATAIRELTEETGGYSFSAAFCVQDSLPMHRI